MRVASSASRSSCVKLNEAFVKASKAAFKSTWIGSGQTEMLVPIRELTLWIDSNLLLELKESLGLS